VCEIGEMENGLVATKPNAPFLSFLFFFILCFSFYSNVLFFDEEELSNIFELKFSSFMLWSLLTYIFVESNLFTLSVSVFSLYFILAEAEKLFSSTQHFIRFVFFIVLGSSLLWMFFILLWSLLFSDSSFLSYAWRGHWGLIASSSIVLKKEKGSINDTPLHLIYYYLPSILFLSPFPLYIIFSSSLHQTPFISIGIFLSWLFFQYSPRETEIATDSNLAFHTFFPSFFAIHILKFSDWVRFTKRQTLLPVHLSTASSLSSRSSTPPPSSHIDPSPHTKPTPSKTDTTSQPTEGNEKRRTIGQRLVEERMAKRGVVR
jgi:hypothetical protein